MRRQERRIATGQPAARRQEGNKGMLDILFVAAIAGFFAVAILYVLGCEWLGRRGTHERR